MAVSYVQLQSRVRTDTTAAQAGTPVWGDALNGPFYFAGQTTFRLRFTIQATGSSGTSVAATYDLYVSKNGGAYTAIGGTTGVLASAAASSSADQESQTTAKLAVGTGTWMNGFYSNDGIVNSFTLTRGDYTEVEYGLAFDSAHLQPGDHLQFRIQQATTPLTTYTATPDVYYLVPAGATLTDTGTTPALSSGTVYTPTVAALALSGGTPAFTITAGPIVPAAASLTLSTYPDTATRAWVGAVVANGGTVSNTRQSTIDDFILGLKADGVWAKLDRLWVHANENSVSARVDLVGLELAGVVGSPTFTVDRGYAGTDTGTPATNYLTTAKALNTYSQYALNSAHLSVWTMTNLAATLGGGQLGASDATNTCIIYDTFSDSNVYLRINESVTGSTARGIPSTRIGQYTLSRTGANVDQGYVNGISTYTINFASQGIPSYPLTICADNGSGTVHNGSPNQIAIVSIGGGFTATDALNFYTRSQTYMNVMTTFVPSAQSLVLSADTPALSYYFNYVPSVATIALSTDAPAITNGLLLIPTVATLTLSTNTLGLGFGYAPTVASLTLSPTTPGLGYGTGYQPTVATLALSTGAPGLGYGTNIQPTAAALTLSTDAPGLGYGTTIQPAAAALALSSTAPTLVFWSAYAPANAALALTATTPVAQQIAQAVPGSVSLGISANTPAFTLTTSIQPGAGVLAIAVGTPVSQQDAQRSGTATSLTLAPTTPPYTLTTNEAPASATLALSATTPAVVLAVTRTPTVGTLALAATAPTLSWLFNYVPAATSLALAPTTPPYTLTQKLAPAGIALTLSASTPLFVLAITRTPTVGILALAATTPVLVATSNEFPLAGSVTFTYGTPVLRFTLQPTSIALVLSVLAPNVILAINCSPTVGTLALASTTPTLSWLFDYAPTAASLALAPTTPPYTLTTRDTPGDAALALTGSAPIIRTVSSFEITPAEASALIFVAGAPHAVEQIRASPPKVAFSLATGTPVMVQRFYIGADGIALGLQPKPPRIDWHVMAHAHFNKNFKGQSREGRM